MTGPLPLSYFVFLTVVTAQLSGADVLDIRSHVDSSSQAVAAQDVIRRLLPENHQHFIVKVQSDFLDSEKREKFQLEWRGELGKIVITGTTAVVALFGLNHYLKYYCNCHISWDGNQLSLPEVLPQVTLERVLFDRFRYYQNACTESYSFVWWKWEEWERHIDWMALNGINLPLAFTGQEEIWLRVYENMGIPSEHLLEEFFTGPAFLSWWRMSNVEGWGGPLPRTYAERKLELLRRIVHRMRQLGMTPVLPAFSGVVPSGLAKVFHGADVVIHNTSWNNFNTTYSSISMLQPTDPLFTEIGRRFIKELILVLGGTDHIYSSDPFAEIQPLQNDSTFLGNLARTTYNSMAAADPKAVWLLQSWMFKYSDFWKTDQARAYLEGVEIGKLIVLDTEAELFPRYHLFDSFYNHSFIWCMLHNYGGTHGMYGGLDLVNEGVALARQNSTSLIGTGMCPEGIDQNFLIYDFMSESSLRNNPADTREWVMQYQRRRYGINSVSLESAWKLLSETVYNGPPLVRFHGRTVLTRRPGFNLEEKVWYSLSHIAEALGHFLEFVENSLEPVGVENLFHFDLVDLTRQFLQNLIHKLYNQLLLCFFRGEVSELESTGNQLLAALDDLEAVLGTHDRFLLGPWIMAAEQWGNSQQEKDLMRFNALNQLTLWGPTGEIVDYGAKMWAGMISKYYKPRWNFFLDRVRYALEDPSYSYSRYKHEILHNIEIPFTVSNFSLPGKSKGDTVSEAKRIYLTWKDLLHSDAQISSSAQKLVPFSTSDHAVVLNSLAILNILYVI